MSKLYNVYRMQIAPEVSRLVQIAERESLTKVYSHILDDECELYAANGSSQNRRSAMKNA